MIVSCVPIVISWIFTNGLMGLFDLQFNVINIIVCTLVFGIGVDYAVNVFARYREERASLDSRSAMIRAAYHTGGAVVLASLSTVIGWGSLVIAGNQAFVSFGKLAVLGEITCVTVAVLVVPAGLIVLRKREN